LAALTWPENELDTLSLGRVPPDPFD